MDRLLTDSLKDHLVSERQMLLLSGPRQVGKTTIARELCLRLASETQTGTYLNWDNHDHRGQILDGPESISKLVGLDKLQEQPPLLALDELHKYPQWRDFLKGLFDTYESRLRILVTGSARLDIFKRGGDSLMGRYFSFSLHPLSVAELTNSQTLDECLKMPSPVDKEQWQSLLLFGGFPEPFLRNEKRFYNRWRALRSQQLFREDVRDLTRVQEVGQLEHLAQLLSEQSGQLTSYSSLAKSVRVSQDTIRRWISILESLYWCFTIRPWHKNVSRSLRKEPKYYLWDWSQLKDPGAQAENLIASALLKAVMSWEEAGLGQFSLHFLRNKDKREVDFIVVRDAEPWFLVEVKSSAKAPLSSSLSYFQQQTGAPHAFQVAMDMPYIERNCFEHNTPIIVPAQTFLSQLV